MAAEATVLPVVAAKALSSMASPERHHVEEELLILRGDPGVREREDHMVCAVFGHVRLESQIPDVHEAMRLE
jgi:hypothetical protein